MTQMLLFPDPRPLVDRLGRDFFRRLPESPGVYLMRDAADTVLYVGKARNLRQRLGSYRVANPDRLRRRHLRLLRTVARIELQECPDEAAALEREAELLRTLRPRFNRAGTWPGHSRFLAWRCAGSHLELMVAETPDAEWQVYGPRGSVPYLRVVLARLVWCALHPDRGFVGLPAGWMDGRMGGQTAVHCGPQIQDVTALIEKLLSGQPEAFHDWLHARIPPNPHPFEKAALDLDLEYLQESL